MTENKKKPSVADGAFNWWRLFHSLLRHGRDEAELARSKAVWSWMSDHYLPLKKIAIGERMDLLSAVWSVANETGELPSYEIVLERVQGMEKNAEPLDALKDYKAQLSNLHVHAPEDLVSVLKDCCADWERLRIYHVLNKANQICQGSEEMGEGKNRKTWSGPRDSVNYLMMQLEEGVLVDSSQSTKPIIVQNESEDVGEHFWEIMTQPRLETGIPNFYIERKDFVGILGYLGSGKSTVGRFILYQLALAGFNVLDISLENSQITERDKFVLLHAHNPKFGGEFDNSISYRKVLEGIRTQTLTRQQVAEMNFVGKDFKETVEGRLIIQQPQFYSWDSIRTFIEMQHAINPLDVCMIDYLSMIDPPTKSYDDQRVKMSAMVKAVRSYGLHFDGGRGLCIISPVQANEAGRDKATDEDGVYKSSAINNDKELGRSMTVILGVFNKGVGLMLSMVKDREAFGMKPDLVKMSESGWIGNRPVVAAMDVLDRL